MRKSFDKTVAVFVLETRDRSCTLDGDVPLQVYDDIPTHDHSTSFYDFYPDYRYEDVQVTSPRFTQHKRSQSSPLIGDDTASYVSMNDVKTRNKNAAIVNAALCGDFSSSVTSQKERPRDLQLLSDANKPATSEEDFYVSPSLPHAPAPIPNLTVTPASSVTSSADVTVQRNKTICGKASLMPSFVDSMVTRSISRDELSADVSTFRKHVTSQTSISSSTSSSTSDDAKGAKNKNKRKKKGKKSVKEASSCQVQPPLLRPIVPSEKNDEQQEDDVTNDTIQEESVYETPVNNNTLTLERKDHEACPPNVYIDESNLPRRPPPRTPRPLPPEPLEVGADIKPDQNGSHPKLQQEKSTPALRADEQEVDKESKHAVESEEVLLRVPQSHARALTLRRSCALKDSDGYEYVCDQFAKVTLRSGSGEEREYLRSELDRIKVKNSLQAQESMTSLSETEFACPSCAATFDVGACVTSLPDAILFPVENGGQPEEEVCCDDDRKCEYYCYTCDVSMCRACYATLHAEHRCDLLDVITSYADRHLQHMRDITDVITRNYEFENMQMSKYLAQYGSREQKVLSDVTYAYAEARARMEEAYVELSRHVAMRFEEERKHVRQLQQVNERTIERLQHVANMADRASSSAQKVSKTI